MIVIDMEKLEKNLLGISKLDEFDPAAGENLKKLFLVLAGDQRVIKKITLEEMSELFSESPSLLRNYMDGETYHFKESQLEDYRETLRRAV